MYVSVSDYRNKVEVGDIISIPNVIKKGVVSYFIIARVDVPTNDLNNVIMPIDIQTGDNFNIRHYTDSLSYSRIPKTHDCEQIDMFVREMGGTIYKNKNTYLNLCETGNDDDNDEY